MYMDASVLNENNRETTATVREAALEPVRLAEQRNAEEHGIDEQLGLAVGTNGELTRRSPEPRQTTPAESSRTHQEAAGAVDVIAAWSPLRADEWRIARDVRAGTFARWPPASSSWTTALCC